MRTASCDQLSKSLIEKKFHLRKIDKIKKRIEMSIEWQTIVILKLSGMNYFLKNQ